MVSETLPLVGLPYVEAIAVISCYNPFFEKDGMRKIMERFPDHDITEAIEHLHRVRFEPTVLSSTHYNLEKLKNMKPMQITECREILASVRSPRLKFSNSYAPYGFANKYHSAVEKVSLEKLARMLKALSFLAQTKVYLLWKDPRAQALDIDKLQLLHLASLQKTFFSKEPWIISFDARRNVVFGYLDGLGTDCVENYEKYCCN
ncbi:MAG: hypothetical protein OEZ29_01530 [Candidatus Bathyarchaeota archaeon]|nr:hypothetical protein [Candidatus Bathyarchaeota archaeon]MDH5779257.1 hypothetical protein [Candidatus Bathyarchaeota archaeon]